jgi:archaellum component FlaG (FlaF/FlaG flagellin family)
MADGGASSFIFLTTALLVSGLVSVVLINQWGGMAQITAQETAALEVQEATSVDFAGDPMMVDLNTTRNEITFFLQNTGTTLLDSSTLVVLVDGQTISSSINSSLVPVMGDWDEDHLLEVTVHSSSWTYQSGDDIALTVIVSSEVTNGYRGSDSTSLEVRLHG